MYTNCALVCLITFMLQMYAVCYAETQSQSKQINSFDEAVSAWEKNKCIFPDSSFYKENALHDASPKLKSCHLLEINNAAIDDLSFKKLLCQNFYLMSVSLCQDSQYQDSQHQDFIKDCLNPAALAKITFDKSAPEMDVCSYVSNLDKLNKQYDFMRDFDLCKRNCMDSGDNSVRDVCELYVSIVYQIKHRKNCLAFKANTTKEAVGDKKEYKTNITNGVSQTGLVDASVNKGENKSITQTTNEQPADMTDNKLTLEMQTPLPAPPGEADGASTVAVNEIKVTVSVNDTPTVSITPQTEEIVETTDSAAIDLTITPNDDDTDENDANGSNPEDNNDTEQPPKGSSSDKSTTLPLGHGEKGNDGKNEIAETVENNNEGNSVQNEKQTNTEENDETVVENEKTETAKNEEDEKETVKEKSSDDSGSGTYSGDEESPASGHFLAYFLTAVVICISGYVIYHNKQKILAFIIEGRNSGKGGRQRSKDVKYTQLKSNVEEVMPSLEQTATSKNFVY